MAFGIYIHIPYCLQRCHYCDFATVESDHVVRPPQYVELLKEEIRSRHTDIGPRPVSSIYFGGGTPSLLEPELILSVLTELANHGFEQTPGSEISIEINPGTVPSQKLDGYLAAGVNRFSVGAQTFNERHLKRTGRLHSVSETEELLSRLAQRRVNYSFDLLFGLPDQSLPELESDVRRAMLFDPSHLSAYCLTVPEGHSMSKGRASDEEQVAMFDAIGATLLEGGIRHYEISNYARPGRESRHNLLYWTDQEYWGIGMGAHSYLRQGPWGLRLWNPSGLKAWSHQVRAGVESPETWKFLSHLPASQKELLQTHQALTDYAHTSLRLMSGLNEEALRLKFGPELALAALQRLGVLQQRSLVETSGESWRLTREGRMVANTVFEALTFLSEELPSR